MVSQELISFLCNIPLTISFPEKDLHSFLILLSCAVKKNTLMLKWVIFFFLLNSVVMHVRIILPNVELKEPEKSIAAQLSYYGVWRADSAMWWDGCDACGDLHLDVICCPLHSPLCRKSIIIPMPYDWRRQKITGHQSQWVVFLGGCGEPVNISYCWRLFLEMFANIFLQLNQGEK